MALAGSQEYAGKKKKKKLNIERFMQGKCFLFITPAK